ncbi:MAG: protein kinase [Geobacteraceae bacterium]
MTADERTDYPTVTACVPQVSPWNISRAALGGVEDIGERARLGEAAGDELPEAVRREARDRIQAGLYVRQLRSQERRPPSGHAEELPRLSGFRIERKLGEGGLGVVYAAYDEKLNRRVVIKVLRRHADEQVRLRVLDEARHAAALSDPAVVTVFSVLDETDPPAIVMEFVEGYPLDRFAAQLGIAPMAGAEAAGLCRFPPRDAGTERIEFGLRT